MNNMVLYTADACLKNMQRINLTFGYDAAL